MHADLAGALEQLNKCYKSFEHRGQKMTKEQVRKVLKYGLLKGYSTTAEFTDEEVDQVLSNNSKKQLNNIKDDLQIRRLK